MNMPLTWLNDPKMSDTFLLVIRDGLQLRNPERETAELPRTSKLVWNSGYTFKL